MLGAHTVTVTTAGGTSGAQTFTVNPPPPTLTSVAPNQGIQGATVAVTLTGTNFVVGATTVNVGGGDVTVNNVVVGSSTSLTANFVLALASLGGARTVTVTTAGGTSGPQTFTITLPAPGSQTFVFSGGPQTFTVPAGVVNVTILAAGGEGGLGFGSAGNLGGAGGLGGRTTATVPVTPGASLTVLVGGVGPNGNSVFATAGGFNGGGGSGDNGGGGGGASSVLDGATPLVVVGGGGGGGGGDTVAPVGGNGEERRRRRWSQRQFWPEPPGAQAAGEAEQNVGGGGGFRAAASNGSNGTSGTAGQGGVGGQDIRRGWWRRGRRGLLRRRRWRRWGSTQRQGRRGRRGRLVVRGAWRDGCPARTRGQSQQRFCDDFVVDGDAL